MMPDLPSRVEIVEVGPRDGLQNEPRAIPAAGKIAFITDLAAAGLRSIEATSFVTSDAIPQLADAEEVVGGLPAVEGVTYSALVPNMVGLERAAKAGIRRIAVFTAAFDTFARRNINMSIDESLETFREVAASARNDGMSVRGYISNCFVCPYEGEIAKERVADVTERLLGLGADEVAISDTIGAAAPGDIVRTLDCVMRTVPREKLALHLHDTYGTALANVYAGLQLGITTFDASAGGLGGCPYAPGAAGNLATEDLVYFLDRLGIESGVDLDTVFAASRRMEAALGRDLPSRQYRRLKSAAGLGPTAPS